MDAIWAQYDMCLHEKKENESHTEDLTIDDNICNNCKNQINIDITNGVYVCSECGFIKNDFIFDESAEWIFNSSDNSGKKDPSRCGAPINQMLEKSSMSTLIGGHQNTFMKRLHFQMSMDYVERARYHIFEQIYKMANEKGKLSPNIIEQAKYYYMTLSKRKLSRGSIRQGLIACCILYACKHYKVSRSIKEISEICNVSVPILNKTSKLFVEIMKDVLIDTSKQSSIISTDFMDLITRFVGRLEIEKQHEKLIIKTIKKYETTIKNCTLLDCKTPSSIAASIILYTCHSLQMDVNKNKISSKLDVSIVTINKIYKIIKNEIENAKIMIM